jgi:serine/threonine protein kinase
MQKGPISAVEAVDIAEQVADGLGYAHERGVVHRDIKPSNIMLLPRGQVKIMDFGIARVRVSDHKTSTGVVLGTPRYMSPEQVAGSPVDHRSDIFSLGIVLYEMLTRASLFAGADTPQILHNVVHVEHMPPSRLNREVPSMLDFVIARALKKDPAARAIGSDTRLPLSRQFDSSAALGRLSAPTKRDRELLARPPRPVGFLRRLRNDPGPRLLFIAALAAALVGGAIAFA